MFRSNPVERLTYLYYLVFPCSRLPNPLVYEFSVVRSKTCENKSSHVTSGVTIRILVINCFKLTKHNMKSRILTRMLLVSSSHFVFYLARLGLARLDRVELFGLVWIRLLKQELSQVVKNKALKQSARLFGLMEEGRAVLLR